MNWRLKLQIGVLAASAALTGVAAAASSPAVTTGKASSVGSSSAILNGTVNPNGAATSYSFQYGLTKSYGVSTGSRSAGHQSKALAAKITVHGLLPGTVYHYHLLASNRFGGATGRDRTFRTSGHPPPTAATGPATQVSTSGATLTGVINPQGETTTYFFQFGLSANYGSQTSEKTVAAGKSAVTASQSLSGLASGTRFHYRIVALHGSSAAQYGADATFFTEPSPRPRPRVRAKTTPHRASSAPYAFTTSGAVIGPSSIPKSAACAGKATVRFLRGRHQVSVILVAVQPDCTFSGQTVFNHLPGHGKKHRTVHLRVLVHFRGNGYLAPADAHRRRVVLVR